MMMQMEKRKILFNIVIFLLQCVHIIYTFVQRSIIVVVVPVLVAVMLCGVQLRMKSQVTTKSVTFTKFIKPLL